MVTWYSKESHHAQPRISIVPPKQTCDPEGRVLNSAFWPLFQSGENNMQIMITFLMFVLAVPLQRIETQYPDRAKVTRIETAMNHLTVIELTEPVTLAAAGSPSYKIERRDNKVFIQPLEEGASTNLFVW